MILPLLLDTHLCAVETDPSWRTCRDTLIHTVFRRPLLTPLGAQRDPPRAIVLPVNINLDMNTARSRAYHKTRATSPPKASVVPPRTGSHSRKSPRARSLTVSWTHSHVVPTPSRLDVQHIADPYRIFLSGQIVRRYPISRHEIPIHAISAIRQPCMTGNLYTYKTPGPVHSS